MREFEEPKAEIVIFRADAVVTSWSCPTNCDDVCDNDCTQYCSPNCRKVG